MLVRAGRRYTPACTIMASDNLQELETNFMCDPDADGGFVYTTVEAAINWMHKYSMWPMPMGTSCCAIEYMAASCSRYDISRFGAEVNRYTPHQADFMFICGTITYKMAMLVRRIWDQMPEPKWCIACGACAAECPVEAISEGDGKYEIDAEKCIDCGVCADTCPVSAPEQA